MHLGDWASWATIIATLIAVGGIIKFLLVKALKPFKRELENNGGSSMKDTLERVETKLTDHLVASAAKTAEQDTRLGHIEKVLRV